MSTTLWKVVFGDSVPGKDFETRKDLHKVVDNLIVHVFSIKEANNLYRTLFFFSFPTVVCSPSGTQLKRPTPPREAPDQSVDDGFVVHRSKGVPTLSSMNEPLIPARIRQAKEKSNNDSKADERGKNFVWTLVPPSVFLHLVCVLFLLFRMYTFFIVIFKICFDFLINERPFSLTRHSFMYINT